MLVALGFCPTGLSLAENVPLRFLIGQCGTPFGCCSLYLVGTAAISKYSQWLPSTNQKRKHPPSIRFPGNFWHDIS